MSKQLKQVINLSKKTGDRIIVFDNSEPEDSFVVMTLEQYEKLLNSLNNNNLTDKKIIDKIENADNNNNINPDNSLKGYKNNWKIPKEVKEESEE
jgi:hypothetical protein